MSGEVGAYTIQAAISGVHAPARDVRETDWGRIVALYDVLLRAEPSPVAESNRAVAIAMRDTHFLPIVEMEDFGESMTEGLREQEDRPRARVEQE